MGAYSGKNGTVKHGQSSTVLAEVTNWTMEPKTNIPKWASNTSSGFKTGVAGVRDSSGTVECKHQDTGGTPFQDGDSVTLELHVDATGNNYYKVPAIIESTPVSVDIDNGEAVGITYNWQGIGPWVGYGTCAPQGSSSGN